MNGTNNPKRLFLFFLSFILWAGCIHAQVIRNSNSTIYECFFEQYQNNQNQNLPRAERYRIMRSVLQPCQQAEKALYKAIQNSIYSAVNVDDQYWDDRFFLAGLDGEALSMVSDGNNGFYLGGTFTHAGGTAAGGIAYFNGSEWQDLNGGTNGMVTVVVRDGNDIYIGGYFTKVGNTSANNIAKWNGHSWSSLGQGVDNGVWAIAVEEDHASPAQPLVYAGGEFEHTGNGEAKHLAVWNGSRWQQVDGGTDGPVLDILSTSMHGLIIAGGFESVAGQSGYNGIARRVEGQWHAFGEGLDAPVVDIAFQGVTLYAGGFFERADGMKVNHIASWQEGDWFALNNGVDNHVYSISIEESMLCIAGHFDGAGQTDLGNIALWQQGEWHDMQGGTNGADHTVYTTFIRFGNVYAGGDFMRMGNQHADKLAMWNGTTWSALGQNRGKGVNEHIYAMDSDDDRLVVGGKVVQTGNQYNSGASLWNGEEWLQMSDVLQGTVTDVAFKEDVIYIAGSFYQTLSIDEPPYTIPLNHVAIWDGSQWQTLANGLGKNSYPQAIEIIGDEIYVAGRFERAGEARVQNIARWDGTAWHDVDGGVNGTVYDLASDNSGLYVVGDFTSAGGLSTRNIARYDGTSWVTFPQSDFNGGIHAIELRPHMLTNTFYIGGNFTRVGSLSAQYIVKWTGSQWRALDDSLSCLQHNGCVYDIELDDSAVYVAGRFSHAGEKPANNIALWHGNGWLPLGNGIDGVVHALEIFENALYVGGEFTKAGNQASHALARWELHGISPLVNIDVSSQYGFTPFSVVFDASQSVDPDGEIISYQWDFDGDGIPDSDNISDSFVYSVAGDYTAELIVTDDSGLSASETVLISVAGAPNIDVVYESTSIASEYADVDFDTLVVNQKKTIQFQLKNRGTEALKLQSKPPIFMDTVHFALSQQPDTTIAIGEQFTFEITFEPLFAGKHTAEVYILNNDPDQTGFYFQITGVALSDEVVYVDAGNKEGPWYGTKKFPFNTIQFAVNSCNSGDSIFVHNGTYERFTLSRPLKIRGQSAEKTIIDAEDSGYGIRVDLDSKPSNDFQNNPLIAGFTVKNAKTVTPESRTLTAIHFVSPVHLTWIIRNNIICDNNCGISLGDGHFSLFNNRFYNNNNNAVLCRSSSSSLVRPRTVIGNNVFYKNGGAALNVLKSGSGLWIYSNLFMLNGIAIQMPENAATEWTRIEYNDFYQNNENYPDNCYGRKNLYVDPYFADAENSSFYLCKDSPCIDSGNPGRKLLDVDGTPNDMGCFGGPYGESYTYPPRILNLALHKPVTTGSNPKDGYKLVDGDWFTYWHPLLTQDKLSLNRISASVDLCGHDTHRAAIYDVQYVLYKIGLDFFPIIHDFRHAPSYFIRNVMVAVETSQDNRVWNVVDIRLPRFERMEHIYLKQAVKCRYVRLSLRIKQWPYLDKSDIPKLNYRFYEMEVYSHYPKKKCKYRLPDFRKGWQLISFPGSSNDMSLSAMFTEDDIVVMGYDGTQYTQMDTLRAFQGYWVMNLADKPKQYEYSIVGDSGFSHTFLQNGWHLIGTGTSKVDLTRLYVEPENSVLSYAYEYDNQLQSYVSVLTMYPQKGYWIFVQEPCRISTRPFTDGLKKGISNFVQVQPPASPVLNEQQSFEKLPLTFSVTQNYPNPFNPVTTISYDLPEDQVVRIKVFNMKGEYITTLLEQNIKAGRHQIEWNGRNQYGQKAPSGLYLIEFECGGYQKIIKALLVK